MRNKGTPRSKREEEEMEMLHGKALQPLNTHVGTSGYTQRNCGEPSPEHIFLKDCSPWRSHDRTGRKK